jgi:hypothetical protein
LPAKERERTRKSKMEIGQKFNKLTLKEYFFYIENSKKYTDFNTLGLYRSILENEKLSVAEKIEVRDFANQFFQKTFDFLVIKDPFTFFGLSTLGKELTIADEKQFWKEISKSQEKILKDKRIKHRNFGEYSKHNCGYETCNMNGLMIRQDSFWTESKMFFESNKNRWCAELKSLRNKKERKKEKQTVQKILKEEDFFEAGRVYEMNSPILAFEAARDLQKFIDEHKDNV